MIATQNRFKINPAASKRIEDLLKAQNVTDLRLLNLDDIGLGGDCDPCGCPVPIKACDLAGCVVEEAWYQCLDAVLYTKTLNTTCSKIKYDSIATVELLGTTSPANLLQPIFGPVGAVGSPNENNNQLTIGYDSSLIKTNTFTYVVQVPLSYEMQQSIQSMGNSNATLWFKIGGVWYVFCEVGTKIATYTKDTTQKFWTVTVTGSQEGLWLPIEPAFVNSPDFAPLFNQA